MVVLKQRKAILSVVCEILRRIFCMLKKNKFLSLQVLSSQDLDIERPKASTCSSSSEAC